MWWRNKKAVITGGAGFVGTHLVKHLLAQKADVHVMDVRMPKELQNGAKYHLLDCRDYDNCLSLFSGAAVVFNLAAKVAGVEYNQNNNLKMFEENTALLTTPVIVADKLNIPAFVQMSSVCVYPDGETSPCDERRTVYQMGKPNEANLGYASAKRVGEQVAMLSGIERMIIARPTNIYGPGDDFGPDGHVIPALIKKALNNDVIVVNGTGQEVREFIYVEDVAAALAHLATSGKRGIYNIGTSSRTAVKISQLMAIIQAATDTRDKPVRFEQKFNAGDNKRYTNSFALKASGYMARTTVEHGIGETVKWWRRQ